MTASELEQTAWHNVRSFTLFRVFFTARFYYPVYALLFLDYGLTLGQFAILNGLWAVTIVFFEVPSGALADTLGRRKLLIIAGSCMLMEMAVLLLAPIGGGTWLFTCFALNRLLSGIAEAAASGADEALTYDSLKAAGLEGRWGKVLERVQRDTSLGFFFAMMIGAAVYDPQMINAILVFFGQSVSVDQSDLIKLPIFLTLLSAVVVFWMALRMQEAPREEELGIRETLARCWRETGVTARWIWTTYLPFCIILAAMVLDSVIRQFLTLASEYWNVINLPIASYGLIGSGMALMGLFVPRVARILAEKRTPLQNFITTAAAVFIGLVGLGFAIPYWGIIPAIFLYASIQLTGFFVSRYLNEAAPSKQRATVLSFRGLSTNFSYGILSFMYSGLIVWIKTQERGAIVGNVSQQSIFVESLQWLPWYFLVCLGLVFVSQHLRFGNKQSD